MIDRREFLARLGRWSMGVLVSTASPRLLWAGGRDEGFQSPGFPRIPIPGACLQPATQVEKTLAAIVDTVVPGPTTDPDGAPGALEACAMNLLADEFYPFKMYAGIITSLMDQLALAQHGAKFIDLTYEQRLTVLVEAQKTLPVLTLAYRAIRSAFYGGAYNGVGLDYLGYPGPNLGYRHLEEASFRKAVCKEMSGTGWLP